MAANPGQSGSLGARLRAVRRAADLTGDELAAQLGWPASMGRGKVSKIERDRQDPSKDEIRDWLRICGHLELLDELLDLLAELKVSRTHYRDGLTEAGAVSVQQHRNQTVFAAKLIRTFENGMIPGLLQTAQYAKGVIEGARLLFGPTVDVDGAVQKRMERQPVTYDTAKSIEFVFTESALYLMPCSQAAMIRQLDYLLEVADMGIVTLAIIPFGVQLPFMPYNGFTLQDDMLIVETLTGSEENTGDAAAKMQSAFALLIDEAVTGEAARQLITRARERTG